MVNPNEGHPLDEYRRHGLECLQAFADLTKALPLCVNDTKVVSSICFCLDLLAAQIKAVADTKALDPEFYDTTVELQQEIDRHYGKRKGTRGH